VHFDIMIKNNQKDKWHINWRVA